MILRPDEKSMRIFPTQAMKFGVTINRVRYGFVKPSDKRRTAAMITELEAENTGWGHTEALRCQYGQHMQ